VSVEPERAKRAEAERSAAAGVEPDRAQRGGAERSAAVGAGALEAWARPAGAPFPPAPVPSGAFAIYPVSACELVELLAYDRARCGLARGPLLAERMAALPDAAFVGFAKPGGALAGFVLASPAGIGPLVADAPEVAALLLHACESAGAPPRLLVRAGDAPAGAVLARRGYARVAGPLPPSLEHPDAGFILVTPGGGPRSEP
jgi:hypothetical protein